MDRTDVAVLGLPDARWGESVVAYVVQEEPVGEEELILWARDRLATYKKPRRIVFMDAATSKIESRTRMSFKF